MNENAVAMNTCIYGIHMMCMVPKTLDDAHYFSF
jgi:hypothetical protein